jgi:UDP-glucose 4-epimerase
MKVALLGANGLVGRYLASSLKYNVTPVTRREVDLSDTVATANYFKNNKFDVVVNCAINSLSQMTVPQQVATDNLTTFANLYACKESYGRFIHFGSGAEFDRRYDIINASEDKLITSYPTDPYGMSKNITSRLAFATDNFYILRLFGVFHNTEAPTRLLPKLLSTRAISLEDKYFDYLNLEDTLPIVDYFIRTPIPKYKDINLVYPEKMLLSEFVNQFCKIHNMDASITISKDLGLSYTGDSTRLQELDLPTLGIKHGLERYK